MLLSTNKNNINATSQNNKHVNSKHNVNTNTSETNQKTSSTNSTSMTNWTTQKKRNHSNSSYSNSEPPTSPQDHPHTHKNKKKLFITKNRYEVLSQTEQPPETSMDAVPSPDIEPEVIAKPPPPIFIKDVHDFPALCTELIDLIGVDNFHLIRNLHPSTPTDLLKTELETRLFEVRQVTQVLHRLNKNQLPLFFVDLEPTIHSNEIFQLTSILHTKIKVEEPYKIKAISQCANCQAYGHTKAYCGYSPRCVRCGNGHPSSSCQKTRDEPPCCALCQESHPANYKGCSVYKELQYRKKPSSNNNKFIFDNKHPSLKSNLVKDSHPSEHINSVPPTAPPLTYAKVTSNQFSRSNSTPTTQDNSPSAETNLSHLMSSFLNDFKTLINPLISLLTTVISSLLDKSK
ncbi:hypothetical protein QTP88_011178 [Uroleucon formosanum]